MAYYTCNVIDCHVVPVAHAVQFDHPHQPVPNAHPVHPVSVIVHSVPILYSINTHPPLPPPPHHPHCPARSFPPAHQFHHFASTVPDHAIVLAYIKIIPPLLPLPPHQPSDGQDQAQDQAQANHQYTIEFRYHLDGDIKKVSKLLSFKNG